MYHGILNEKSMLSDGETGHVLRVQVVDRPPEERAPRRGIGVDAELFALLSRPDLVFAEVRACSALRKACRLRARFVRGDPSISLRAAMSLLNLRMRFPWSATWPTGSLWKVSGCFR